MNCDCNAKLMRETSILFNQFRYGEPGSGAFPQIGKLPVAQSFAPLAVMAGRCSGGPTCDYSLVVCLCDLAAGKRHQT